MAASKSKPSNRLQEGLEAFLAARLAAQEPLCVAFSGGRDSALLLHFLARCALGGRLSAIHVHHGLSPKADAWAEFCRDFCARRGVPLTVARVTVARHDGRGLEAAARAARYEALAQTPAPCLFLAHHRGDQAETALFNLLRGSGVAGAAAMPVERPWRAKRLLRPWLAVAAEDIRAAAIEAGLTWVEDESNADTGLTRNFLRHRAFPLLAERFPGLEDALATAAAHFAEADDLLLALAAEDWARLARHDALPRRDLSGLPAPRLKNLLRFRLRQLGWQAPAAARLEEFVRQLQTAAPDRHPALALPQGVMRVQDGHLVWLAAGRSE